MKLISKSSELDVMVTKGETILDHALQFNLEWGFSCLRGTCARCRCHIESGQDGLEPLTEMEELRLTEEEIEQGYRLGCQAIVKEEDSPIIARWKPYF
jgi:2Fe-2S ferredoxin